MKKIVVLVLGFIVFSFASFAQQSMGSMNKKLDSEIQKVNKSNEKVVVKKVETKVVLKKDGTPDKRYKKTTVGTVVLKKDGTPDKRYKKTTVKKVILKKDGTPDKRYKNSK